MPMTLAHPHLPPPPALALRAVHGCSHCDNDKERVEMTLWEAALFRVYVVKRERYEALRRRHRKRKRAYERMQRALHNLMREECHG